MLGYFLFISSLIYLVSGTGELVILQAPKSLQFTGKEVIDGHDIPEVIASSLGFSTRKSSNWPGLAIKDPFGFADVVAVVAINGVQSLGDFGKHSVYPISPVQDEYKTWRIVQDDFLEHYPTIETKKNLQRIDLGSKGSDFSDVKVQNLDKLNDEDSYFLQDLLELNSYVAEYEMEGVSTKETPRVNWYTLSSLHPLVDLKGAEHEAVVEAKEMLRSSLEKLGQTLSTVTGGRALVAVIVTDGAHTRHQRDAPTATNRRGQRFFVPYPGYAHAGEAHARHARAAPTVANNTIPDNRATVYSEAYPAIFNIMLWFGVAFVFSLIAISLFIGNMDPGRDSIIYRMTSNRIKKDS